MGLFKRNLLILGIFKFQGIATLSDSNMHLKQIKCGFLTHFNRFSLFQRMTFPSVSHPDAI